MTEYWTTRSARERALILVAGGLVAVLLLNLLVVSPLRTAKAEAEAAVSIAARTLDAVSAAAPAARQADGTGNVTVTGANLRGQLVELARQRGLAVSRLQSSEKGAIIIQFDQATTPLLFAWLETAERQTGARPAQAAVFAEASGGVRASFEFQGDGD